MTIREKGYEISYITEEGVTENQVIKEVLTPLTIPLGYGKIAPAVAIVQESEDEDVKKGDLVIRYGLLKTQVETGSALTVEQKQYAKDHTVVQLVMTKRYAKTLATMLMSYANLPEDKFVSNLKHEEINHD